MSGTGRPHLWHCWALGDDGRPLWFASVDSEAYDDRERVELPATAAAEAVGTAAVGTVHLDADGRGVRVELAPGSRSDVPDVWCYEVQEAEAQPPATVLMVFAGHGVPAGSVRRDGALGDPPVTGADQLAAVRWYPATGEVDQIYVAPSARRRGLATSLVLTAALLNAVRGLPRLWGDGQRTDLGESWVTAQSWSGQASPRTHVAPPMTPGEAGA